MSFRLRIVLMTMALITLLFSVGGTMLIHSSFQTSLEKEEQSVVSMNEMILRVVQYVGKDGTWITEEELVEIIDNFCQQDHMNGVQLMLDDEIVYMHQKGHLFSNYMNKMEYLEENKVQISYFTSEQQKPYLQSSTKFVLNGRVYYLDICSELTDIYEVREEQITL
ncbi:MAG: hypothetical protein IJ958_00910, partial [Agathobacter sp.]|nr:hypothetical protein [Agathobacter sp.]